MKEKDMEALTQRIQEKLGEENSALIADDLGLLLSDTKIVNDTEEDLHKQIGTLREQKEKLIETNGNLLQQISVGEEPSFNRREEEKQEEKKAPYDFRTALDKYGNFIR